MVLIGGKRTHPVTLPSENGADFRLVPLPWLSQIKK